MRPHGVFLTPLLLMLCGAEACAQTRHEGRPQSPSFDAVCSQPWSVRRIWEDRLTPPYPLDQPSAAEMADTVVLAGTTLRPEDDRPMGDSMAVLTLDGRRIAFPAGARSGIYPKIAGLADTLYLVWGEAEPAHRLGDGPLAWPPRVRKLWFTSRIGSGQWMQPQLLTSAQGGVWWSPEHVSRMLLAPDGALELAFATYDSAAEGDIVIARFAGRAATMERHRRQGVPIYVRMTRRADTAYLMYSGPNFARLPDVNSLFLVRRLTQSVGWSEERLVHPGGNHGAAFPQMTLTRDGGIHIVWAGLETKDVLHRRSMDGGRTWSSPDRLQVSAYPREAAPVGDSAVAILYEDNDYRGSSRVAVACWSRSWLRPNVAPPPHLSAPVFLNTHSFEVVAIQRDVASMRRYFNVLVAPSGR